MNGLVKRMGTSQSARCLEGISRMEGTRLRSSERSIRVVLAKMGLDCHDRGAKAVAHFLRESGMEVIYTGLFQTVDQVINTTIQEDADVVGISCLSGEHLTFVPSLLERMKEQGLDDRLVLVGGAIPVEDVPFLKEKGVHGVFSGAVPVSRIAYFIRENLRR